jgi:hypothetical protein
MGIDANRFAGRGFIKFDDVRARAYRGVIAHVEEGKYDRLDLEFQDSRKFGCNATNTATLIENYGGDTDGWIGCTVELHAGQVEFKDAMVDSVLLHAITPATVAKPEAAPAKKAIAPKAKGGMDSEFPD